MEMLPCRPATCPTPRPTSPSWPAAVDYRPQVAVEDGVARFVDWYLEYQRGLQ
jgi:UDP-glucuronate 4-epimerase